MKDQRMYAVIGNKPKDSEFHLTFAELLDEMQDQKYLDCCTVAFWNGCEWQIV